MDEKQLKVMLDYYFTQEIVWDIYRKKKDDFKLIVVGKAKKMVKKPRASVVEYQLLMQMRDKKTYTLIEGKLEDVKTADLYANKSQFSKASKETITRILNDYYEKLKRADESQILKSEFVPPIFVSETFQRRIEVYAYYLDELLTRYFEEKGQGYKEIYHHGVSSKKIEIHGFIKDEEEMVEYIKEDVKKILGQQKQVKHEDSNKGFHIYDEDDLLYENDEYTFYVPHMFYK